MEFLPPSLESYITAHTAAESELLRKINRDTNANVLMPRMLSGHLQGRVLAMLSQMIKPRRVLEIGTYTGYSALCLAEGLSEDGLLYTIDINEELEMIVRNYFNDSGLEHKIKYIIGDASHKIKGLHESFDLVFIDADKRNYSHYYDLVIDKVITGGYIIADNVLWSGKVVPEFRNKMDEDTQAILNYNLKIQQDSRVENVLFPIRDGLMVARKL